MHFTGSVDKKISWKLKINLFLIILAIGLSLSGFNMVLAEEFREVKDDNITSHLETAYQNDKSVPENEIDVTTKDGIVTLSGSVNNILAKDRAQAIAGATVGVKAIVNNLKVVPPEEIDDDELRKAIEKALLGDPATDAYEVNAEVNNGTVTLTGMVDSWQEKQLTAFVVKGVKGVVGIDNNIDFRYRAERSDYEIEQEAKQRLANDVRVDASMISVEVENGKVFLSGAVGSMQEKSLARIIAWVGGVQFVDAGKLEIERMDKDSMRRTEMYVVRPDDEIKETINNAFKYHPRVSSSEVKVKVNNGAVTLSGNLDNLASKRAAENAAQHAAGVNRVINNIKVRPLEIPDDMEIEDQIAEKFLIDPYLERFETGIRSFGGVVYLTGEVNTSWERNRAERIAESVKGVITVENNIEYSYKWDWQPDRDIEENIEDELFWSPFVDEDEVSVSVNNGVAILTGTVDDYGEYQSAEDNAFEGGAKDVINDLDVTGSYYGPYYYGFYSPYIYYEYHPYQ